MALSEEYLLDTVVSTTNKTQYIHRPLQHINSSNLTIFNNQIKTSKLLTMITVNQPSEVMNQDPDMLQQGMLIS